MLSTGKHETEMTIEKKMKPKKKERVDRYGQEEIEVANTRSLRDCSGNKCGE